MKLILNNKDQILFKTSIKDRDTLLRNIKKYVWNINIISRSRKDFNLYLRDFIKEIQEIDINNSFIVNLYGISEICISGDNGVINLQIIDLKEIQEI
jgi:hypothetical protein|tara:strand:+ start:297 stop:587 length:291 start_codon:yes stop_codon:yes gene_type:complete